MTEMINNSQQRIDIMKKLIRQLHRGVLRKRLKSN